jgi:hypothetical protein
MNLVYARVTSGIAFEACDAYWIKRRAADEAVNALAVEFGCTPGRTLSRGSWLEGLHFPRSGVPSKDWSPAGKKFPGYIKPNNRTTAGRAIRARLEAIKPPTSEDLAHLLGYCSAAGCFMRGGAYYLEFPLMLSHRLKDAPGVEFIKEWEYLKAQEEK